MSGAMPSPALPRPPAGTPIYIVGLIEAEKLTRTGQLGRWEMRKPTGAQRSLICVVGHPYAGGRARGIELWCADDPEPFSPNDQKSIRKDVLPTVRKTAAAFVQKPWDVPTIRLGKPNIVPRFIVIVGVQMNAVSVTGVPGSGIADATCQLCGHTWRVADLRARRCPNGCPEYLPAREEATR